MIVHAAVCVFIFIYYTMPRRKSKALFGEKYPINRELAAIIARWHIATYVSAKCLRLGCKEAQPRLGLCTFCRDIAALYRLIKGTGDKC